VNRQKSKWSWNSRFIGRTAEGKPPLRRRARWISSLSEYGAVRVFPGGKDVQTYAFLSQGSTTTLCDRSLPDKLGMSGEEVEFSLTTIT